MAVRRENDLANRRPPLPSFTATHGGTIAAVCSRCRSQHNLRIRHGHAQVSLQGHARRRLDAIKRVWGVIALFLLVIGGIYFGAFTATEGAGIGAGGAFLFALTRRALSRRLLIDVLIES